MSDNAVALAFIVLALCDQMTIIYYRLDARERSMLSDRRKKS